MTTGLGKLLRDGRSSYSIAALAARLGVSERTLSNYELGKSLPDAAFLAKFAMETGTPFPDLIQENLKAAGIDGLQVEEVFARGRLPQSDADEIRLPRLDLSAATHPDGWAESAREAERVGIPRDVLRRMAGGDPDRLCLVTAAGDSMEPTICDRDLVLVDAAAEEIGPAGVYVLVVGGEAAIKRVERLPDGGLWIKSDNSEYSTRTLAPPETATVRVVGRVRAVWHSL